MFSGLLQKFLWANDWERRESFSKFVKMEVIWELTLPGNIPFESHAHVLICFDSYEIENVKQKNSSKCSNLICCRGQVQRPFSYDSLAVRRILVLLMTSNEHRQIGQCIVNGRTAQQQPFSQSVRHLSTLWHVTQQFSCWWVLLSWQSMHKKIFITTHMSPLTCQSSMYSRVTQCKSSEWTLY